MLTVVMRETRYSTNLPAVYRALRRPAIRGQRQVKPIQQRFRKCGRLSIGRGNHAKAVCRFNPHASRQGNAGNRPVVKDSVERTAALASAGQFRRVLKQLPVRIANRRTVLPDCISATLSRQLPPRRRLGLPVASAREG